MKRVCIIGGGPTGMRVAEKLSGEYNVTLFEKSSKLGGCWKIEWCNSYFTEHSPRVISTGYERFFKKIEKYNLSTVPVYNTTATENKIMFAKYIYSNCSFFDTFKFLYGTMFYNKNDTRTVQEWMNDKNITQKGQNGIKKLCIVLATIPENLAWVALCDAVSVDSGGLLVNMTSGDKWVRNYEQEIVNKGCQVFRNLEIDRLYARGNRVTSARLKGGALVRADYFVVCIPPFQLYQLLDKSNIQLPGWNYSNILESSYSSIAFQLHFTTKQDFPEKWCNTCMGDWSIIMLNTSKYYEKFTRDPRVKDVYSCTIVDTFSKSTLLDKSPNDIVNIDDIKNEALRQISARVGYKIKPHKITMTKGLKRVKGVWQGKDSAFAITPHGTIPQKTPYGNLFTVGPHNLNKISVLECAFESADMFYKMFKL